MCAGHDSSQCTCLLRENIPATGMACWNTATWYLLPVSPLFALKEYALHTQVSRDWSRALLTNFDSNAEYSLNEIVNSTLPQQLCTELLLQGYQIYNSSVIDFLHYIQQFSRIKRLRISNLHSPRIVWFLPQAPKSALHFLEFAAVHDWDAMAYLMQGFTSLKRLSLCYCGINHSEVAYKLEEGILRLLNFGLQRLELKGCSIDCNTAIMNSLNKCSSTSELQHFSLDKVPYRDAFAFLKFHTRLVSIRFPVFLEWRFPSRENELFFPVLEELDLCTLHLQREHATDLLQFLKCCPNLKTVIFRQMNSVWNAFFVSNLSPKISIQIKP